MMFYPTLFSGFSKMPGDPGDPWLNQYFLEHSFQLVFNRNYTASPWSPAFFYPFPNVLAFSDNLWGAAPIYWLLRAFASTDTAFQLWMMLVSALNFFGFAFVLHRQHIRRELAGLGAFLFAFGMPRISQISHSQLFPQFFTPLALLCLWEFSRQPTRRRLALSLLLIYLQVLSGIYLGWFLLLSLLVAIPLLWFMERPGYSEGTGSFGVRFAAFCRTHWASVLLMFTGWGLGMVLTLMPYLQVKALIGERTYAEVSQILPRLVSWFLPSPQSPWGMVWYDSVSAKLPLFWEHSLFLGFTVIGLLGLGLYAGIAQKIPPQRFLLVKLCLGVSALLFAISLRFPNGFSLWQFVYSLVPGATAIRAVSRIWTIIDCYLLIAICLSADAFFNSILNRRTALGGQRRMTSLPSIFLGLCLIEQITFNIPAYDKTPYLKLEAEAAQLMQGCEVAYTQTLPAQVVDQLTAMWAGLKANVPVVNGYSGNLPPNYYSSDKPMSFPQVANWLMQSQKGGIEKPQRLCLISRLSKTEGGSKLTFSHEPQFRVTHYQLPISPIPAVDIQYLPSTLPKFLKTGDSFQLPVILKNTSNFTWSSWGRYPTHFSYRWFDLSGRLPREPLRTLLPSDVNPGESTAIVATIQAPLLPGEYRLVPTMVLEQGFWFSDRMPNPLSIPLKVTLSDSL